MKTALRCDFWDRSSYLLSLAGNIFVCANSVFFRLWSNAWTKVQTIEFVASVERSVNTLEKRFGCNVDLGMLCVRIQNARMRLPTASYAVFATLLLMAGLAGAEVDQRDLADLIEQLGHNEYSRREAASEKLIALGETALKAVRNAAHHSDSEVRLRSRRIVGKNFYHAVAEVTSGSGEFDHRNGTEFAA